MSKWISITEIADLTGTGRATVRRRIDAAGLVARDGPKGARLFESVAALRVAFGLDADALDPQRERAAYDKARRELAELTLAERRGEVVGIARAVSWWAGHLVTARQHLLSLPNAVAIECAGAADRPLVHATATRVVRHVLEQLAAAQPLPPPDAA